MIEGRSKAAFKQWLAGRPKEWSKRIEVVAMDGFAGFKTAAAEELPDAIPVMDPFHVVRLAGDALDVCRRRVQQDLFGRRGVKDDPLYKARRTLHTGASLLTNRQWARLDAVFACEEHVEVEATWGIYQRIVAAYREPDKQKAKAMMQSVITTITSGVPTALVEIRKLGGTMKQRAADIHAFFDRPGTSNGPTEAINGRLDHLRGSALGFRNLTNYVARRLLEAGGFKPALHPQFRRAPLALRRLTVFHCVARAAQRFLARVPRSGGRTTTTHTSTVGTTLGTVPRRAPDSLELFPRPHPCVAQPVRRLSAGRATSQERERQRSSHATTAGRRRATSGPGTHGQLRRR